MRVDCVYVATEIKRTERNKQFVMSETTKKRKQESTIMACAEIFQGGGATSAFFLSFSNC